MDVPRLVPETTETVPSRTVAGKLDRIQDAVRGRAADAEMCFSAAASRSSCSGDVGAPR